MANNYWLLGEGGISSETKMGAGPQKAYKRKLAQYADPTTPPQCKVECIHEIEPIPGVILCDGWKTMWRHMEVEWFILVRTPTEQEIQSHVEDCLREAAVSALLSALIASLISGAGGIEAGKAAFIASLLDCLKNHLRDVQIDIFSETHWTDWA